MNTMSNLWSHVNYYLENGYSVIPIRDKQEIINDKVFNAKSPCGRWEKYQKEIATKDELFFLFDKYKTLAIATVTGKVSCNLEGIDVDTKYLATIWAPLYEAIKSQFSAIKWRIIKTPSNGYHIVYRVSGGVIPPNKKIAGRPATEQELIDRPKDKTKWFIESRGEGGYLAAVPTDGYEVVENNEPPIITWEQRCDLWALCESFNLAVKTIDIREKKGDSIYYDENPFLHYNRSDSGAIVLEKFGWKEHSKNSHGVNYTKPNSKSGGIHATYLTKIKLFKFFTSDCEFNNDNTLYNASNIRARLEFNDDKKLLFAALVKEGFGKIKKTQEVRLIKHAALTDNDLPTNISEQAKEKLIEVKAEVKKAMPYGIFWDYDDNMNVIIDRELLLKVSSGLGFRYYKDSLVRIIGKFIHSQTDREFFDAIKYYVISDECKDIYNAWSAFFEKHRKFIIETLNILDENLLLKDDRKICYKFYNNGYVIIEADKLSLKEYNDLDGLVFKSKVFDREFKFYEKSGRYVEFLNKAVRYEDKKDYIEKIIGYLSHDYKDSNTGYIIVQVEECPDPKQGGGSGKNLFVNLLKYTTTVINRNGESVKFDDKFLNSWNREKIFNLSDVPKSFTFSFLRDYSTGACVLKKMHKDEVIIPVEDMCKFIVSTNFSYDVSDGGLKRRIIPIEFTDFFTKCGGVYDYFNCMFPDGTNTSNGWNENDWLGYDNMIVFSIQTWLKGELKLSPFTLSEGGFIKQFEQVHKQYALEFIEMFFEDWCISGKVSNSKFQNQWDEFCRETSNNFKLPSKKINKAIKEYCDLVKVDFKSDVCCKDELNNVIKCRIFTRLL